MFHWFSVDTLLLEYLFLLQQVALVFLMSCREDLGLLKLQLTQFYKYKQQSAREKASSSSQTFYKSCILLVELFMKCL